MLVEFLSGHDVGRLVMALAASLVGCHLAFLLLPRRAAAGLLLPRRAAAGLLLPRRAAAGLLLPQRTASGLLLPRRTASGGCRAMLRTAAAGLALGGTAWIVFRLSLAAVFPYLP